jgi:hypothetical protein
MYRITGNRDVHSIYIIHSHCSETVSKIFLEADARISFRETKDFWNATSGKFATINDACSARYAIKATGRAECLSLVWTTLCSIGSGTGNGNVGVGGENNNSLQGYPPPPSMSVLGSGSGSPGGLQSSPSRGLMLRKKANQPLSTLSSQHSQSVMKCGVLLKKKEVLVGWQSRYLVLYPGRLDYFIDENACRSGRSPRASIPLYDTRVLPAKMCVVNGGEHYEIT